MSVKEEYLSFKTANNLKTNIFEDRVKLQRFLKSRLENIWSEKPKFTNGGLFNNYMTRLAIGFAYYDCRPTSFCKVRCYGLPISGINDYYMFRLAVITSEFLKTGDPRYLRPLSEKLSNLSYVKIGHWGDAVLEQVPVIANIAKEKPNVTFWWYTRKIEIAKAANEHANDLNLHNLRAYLSLDPDTNYPSSKEYPYGITYFVGDFRRHEKHQDILNDHRLVAIFPKKKGGSVEDPKYYGVETHPKLCEEKKFLALGSKGHEMCFSCIGRCRF
jgi:hypothetical protein